MDKKTKKEFGTTPKGAKCSKGFDEKFQTEQQITPASSAEGTAVGQNSFTPKKVEPKGSVLKQASIAKVLIGDNDAASAGGLAQDTGAAVTFRAAGLKTMTFSGTDGTILGSASGTPIVGHDDRASTRFGKKMDATNRKINYLASEQAVIPFDQPAPLGVSHDVQGYNGTPKNVNARLQKAAGATPADLMYQRSIDLITRNAVVFVNGQIVKRAGTLYSDSPTMMRYRNSDGENVTENFNNPRGNYLPTSLTVGITAADRSKSKPAFVNSFKIAESDLSINDVDDAVANVSSSYAIIDANVAELDRQLIDTKAGRETEPTWCPLARAVLQPTQTVGYLRDIEESTGAEIYASYRFANKAMAFQLNKAAKDGQTVVIPRNEMLKYEFYDDQTRYANDYPFEPKAYKAGSAALLIAMFDSTTKYANKADVLTQPRSLKMHIETAKNNIEMYHVKPEFVAALNEVDVFSTIDHDYDGISPIFATDKVRLVHPISFANSFGFTQALDSENHVVRTWTSQLFQYNYANRNSTYNMKVTHPLLAGIAYFFELYAGKIAEELKLAAGASANIVIPIQHSTTFLSLWDFLVLASLPYIQYERINSLRDVMDYEGNFGYPFSQLQSLGNLDPLASSYYELKSYSEPLVARMLPEKAAIHWHMPAVFHAFRANKKDYYELPWYFNEDQFEVTAPNVAQLAHWSGVMSYPVVRAGVHLVGLEAFYNGELSERDLRLCLDRMVTVPGVHNSTTNISIVAKKYSQAEDGSVAVQGAMPTMLDVLRTPRELGWFVFDAYHPGDPADHNGWTVYQYVNYKAERAVAGSLDASGAAIDRALNFTQKWVRYVAGSATNTLYNLGIGGAAKIGQQKCLTDGFVDPNTSLQTPLDIVADQDFTKYFYRVQYLPFVINPFDAAIRDTSDAVMHDLLDFAHLFNMCGYMGSDYTEDQLNRATEVMNSGWMFTKDPFVTDSPIFKSASGASQM